MYFCHIKYKTCCLKIVWEKCVKYYWQNQNLFLKRRVCNGLCALKWSDINFHEQTISISKTCQRIRTNGDTATKLIITSPKNRSSVRIIPLPVFIIKLLKEFIPSDENTYLLYGSDKVIEPRTIQYRFHGILRKAELPSINFHSLRHIFATSCIEIGFDVKTLSEILGHRTVEITLNRYVHSSINRKRECMEWLSLNAV